MGRLKKVMRILICILIISTSVGFILEGYRQQQAEERREIINTPLKLLTRKEKLEDMEYLYKIITENYPYLEVNKRMNGVDWAAQKEAYLSKIRQTATDEEFLKALDDILGELNNGHTQVLTTKEQVEGYRFLYYQMKEQGAWQGVLFDKLNEARVLRRYGIADELPKDVEAPGRMSQIKWGNFSAANENVKVQDIVEGEAGYIQIKQMLNPWDMEGDKEILANYFNRIKDYPVLMIDIRGNGGGDTSYWQNFLVPYLMKEALSVTQYGLYRDGEIDEEILNAQGFTRYRRNKISGKFIESLPELPEEVSENFKYYIHWKTDLKPAEEGIKYSGHIYLLVDEEVYSASEALAVFAKDSGFATLVGGRTGGDGIGVDPAFAVLPNSGYVIRFSLEMGVSQNGTCDEECKTMPDYIIEDARKRSVERDACIQKVLELEGLNN